MVGHMVVANPYIVIHTATTDAAHHLGVHPQSLRFHQIGKNKGDNQCGILRRNPFTEPVLSDGIRRKQFLLVPDKVGELGDDCRGIIQGKGSLLPHSQAFRSAIYT